MQVFCSHQDAKLVPELRDGAKPLAGQIFKLGKYKFVIGAYSSPNLCKKGPIIRTSTNHVKRINAKQTIVQIIFDFLLLIG